MGCKVKVNRHGFLAFQLFWNRNRSWEGTGLRDTVQHRRLVEAKAVLIGREIKSGTFDYLKWFPEGNRAEEFNPKTEAPRTIGDYFRVWIERKKPPVVRKDSSAITAITSACMFSRSLRAQPWLSLPRRCWMPSALTYSMKSS